MDTQELNDRENHMDSATMEWRDAWEETINRFKLAPPPKQPGLIPGAIGAVSQQAWLNARKKALDAIYAPVKTLLNNMDNNEGNPISDR